ncbi:MAG: alginate export family protein [Phycisphaerae bacterium]|nr:alginate export family protein [Phycisphaerae bacterium]NIP50878.1 alginate export family protein [Phycisphaerae bacterium]NIS54749.1 alginate export family protein [Phycisphaerae bacterium]NIU12349.1 alginate export family protein [Phycisphaerae bacterium]NIU60238.1 alginate export family protein [Phycisphaerae bacterium]
MGSSIIKMVTALTIVVVAVIGQVWAADGSLPGPKYQNLRYDEDFSYLDKNEPYEKDAWDSIKWIELDDNWRLTLGGQARFRIESETDKDFGGTSPSQDTFFLQRYFFHADLRETDGLRFFLQGKFAYVTDRDRGGYGGLEDHSDIHQGFGDVPLSISGAPMTIRLGRQEIQYGAQRLISPLDWGNIRRTFDGVKVFTDIDDWRIDAFAVRPVVGDRRNLDDENENIDFYGLYSTWKGTSALSADFYFLLLKNNEITTNSNNNIGRRTVYTIGTRLWGRKGDWDWETEAASQFGTYAGDRIRAWMATAGGGYTFSDVDWTPRVGLLYDYASGDSDPTDGTHSTFNQHFPLGHAWLGYLDRVGRSNIHAIKTQVKVKPTKKITAWCDFHTFFADQDKDALYSAGGVPLRSGGSEGAGSQYFGHELDITLKYAIDRHTTALVGWAHMWPGGFIKNTGPSESPDLLYAQIEYKF